MQQVNDTQDLKQRTAKSFFWGGLSSVLYQILSLTVGILLARYYMTADDYGIMAMLIIFSSISTLLQDSGFSVALINKKNATNDDINAVFWFNALTGIFLYLLLFVSSPLIARFFHAPELESTMRVMMLCLVFNGFSATHNTILVKNLMLKEKAIIDTVSFALASMLGLALAICGLGYWALVVQNGLGALFYLILRWYYSPWRPTLHISLKPLKEMLPFSIKLLFTGLLTTLNNNIFSFLLGQKFNKKVTGYYYEGFKWVNIVYFLIWNTVNNVSQSVLARVADEREREAQVFRKMIRLVSMISFPLFLGLLLVSREFIVIAVTDKWLASIPYLQLFCLWGAVTPLNSLYANMVVSRGRSNIYLYTTVSLGVAQILSAALVLYIWGDIMLMVKVYIALSFIWFLIWNGIAKRILHLSIVTVLWRDVLPFLAATLVSLGAAYLCALPFASIYAGFGVKMAVSVLLYVTILYLSRSVIFREMLQFLFKRKK